MERGKIISIDGNDGVGKETQSKLLQKRLEEMGIKSKVVSFPSYGHEGSIFAQRYLLGEYGNFDDINPELTSMFFALDRFAWFKGHPEFNTMRNRGVWYIFDRYVDSNIIYQGSKAVYIYLKKNNIDINNFMTGSCDDALSIIKEFSNTSKYISKLEYETLGIPETDISIFLKLPRTLAEKLIANRNNKITNSSDKDCHESNTEYLDLVNYMTPFIISNHSNLLDKFKTIDCADRDDEILSKEQITDKIMHEILDNTKA